MISTKKERGFSFAIIPLFGTLLLAISIVLTYYIALKLGHVKPIPNCTISDTAIKYPEYIIFRGGVIVSCILLMFTFSITSWWVAALEKQYQV